MRRIYIIIGVALLLFASCGQQHEAQSVVKDFVRTNISDDVSFIDFADIDSTRAISDSLVQVLRSRVAKNIQYQDCQGHTLKLIRAKYVMGTDTLSSTFYLDPALTGVVAYKEN